MQSQEMYWRDTVHRLSDQSRDLSSNGHGGGGWDVDFLKMIHIFHFADV